MAKLSCGLCGYNWEEGIHGYWTCEKCTMASAGYVIQSHMIETWEFELAKHIEGRESLRTPPPFESIADQIKNELNILCCHADPCRTGPLADLGESSFARICFCIRIPPEIFDSFFNSKNGYRAQYYVSPHMGALANEIFIRTLLPELVNVKYDPTITSDFICESLNSPSSKVWLAEVGKEVRRDCDGCKGEWRAHEEPPEIINRRWEHCERPKWGSQAPYLTKLRIFGAFIDERNNVFLPQDKRFRGDDLYRCGWS
jgi:hypothetical protein